MKVWTVNSALYEWNYLRQMLEIRLQEARGVNKDEIGNSIFNPEFLLTRPLLKAIQSNGEQPPVLLIDGLTAPMRSSKHFCWRYFQTFRLPFLKSAPYARNVLPSSC